VIRKSQSIRPDPYGHLVVARACGAAPQSRDIDPPLGMPQIVVMAVLQLEGRMKYEGFSAQGLKVMHDPVHAATAMDAEAIKKGKTPPCGTNTYPDWRAHALGLEGAMRAKGVDLVPAFPE
jgi:hypothetical protein